MNQTDSYSGSAVLVVYEQNQTRPLAELYIGSYLRSCKQYEVTAEAIGIDILRVQYRQFRRDLIRQIVQQNLHDKALESLIHTHIQQHIPAEHREKCLQDLRFDLEHLAVWNIVGMGISGKELEVWLRK